MSNSTGLSEFSDDLELPDWVLSASQRRRIKALFVLGIVWGFVALLHLIPVTRWAVTGFATLVALHASRIVAAPIQPLPSPLTLQQWADQGSLPLDASDTGSSSSASVAGLVDGLDDLSDTPAETPGRQFLQGWPKVSILVPAKNESAVLPHLLRDLSHLHYPIDLLDLWVVDDASSDDTSSILALWQEKMPHLHVLRRADGSGGGKSGALNEVFAHTVGDIILVCDADAGIQADFLLQALPLFEQEQIGAIQVRKSVANAVHNGWTRRQSAEMIWDACLQSGKVAIGGIGELRGNGQLVRRDSLQRCGGWNEGTVTDDLDLTFRLHLTGVDIACTPTLAIDEEGVTTWKSLWRQRSRWAEGGYQRYLDYWPGILSNQMGTAKTVDLLIFWLVQYLLPMAILPDLLWTLLYSHSSALLPMGMVFTAIAGIGFMTSLYRIQHLKGRPLLWQSLGGMIYMMHWIPVMIVTTARMCIQPKRLHWVKTVHHGRASASEP